MVADMLEDNEAMGRLIEEIEDAYRDLKKTINSNDNKSARSSITI